MKRNHLLLIPIIAFYSCSDQNEMPLTQQITKIETMYTGTEPKLEPIYSGRKIVTSLDAKSLEIYRAQLEVKLKERTYQNGRLNSTLSYERKDTDVGVIPNSIGGCPVFSEPITFFMDCEDDSPSTRWISTGYTGSWSINSNKNVYLRFCRLSQQITPVVPAKDICLLRLGPIVPTYGGAPDVVVRVFDNEDSGNTNSCTPCSPDQSGISPNSQNHYYTSLQFYYYPPTWGGTISPVAVSFPGGFGVVGIGGTLGTGQIYIDDEDGSNANSLTKNGVTTSSIPNNIIGGTDTQIYISKIQN